MNDDTAILQLPQAGEEDHRTDGLAEELAHSAPRRWWNRGTVALAGIVLLAGGFAGGILAQKHYGTGSTASGFPSGFSAGGGAGRYGAGAGSGGFGQGNAGGGAPGSGTATASPGTTGTVKMVDGSTIYVQTSDGSVVTVDTTSKTAVSAASTSTLKNIKAGQKITVQGATASDGSVTATSVTTTSK